MKRADAAAGSSLLGTGVGRARFELGRSTDEADFESDRQDLIDAIDAVHAAEDMRIDELMLSEVQLAALRATNDLARDTAIARATGLENTFTTQRIDNEMDVAEAAAEAAQAQIDAGNEAVDAAIAAKEELAAAEAKRAADEMKAAEAAAVAAERQAQRESNAAAGLLQTGVGQARFDLGLSGSEGEFEANRIALINATNAFYDNELANINKLELSEIELTDLRTANELKRQQALSRATTATNSFTTARIAGEERAADEIERIRDAAIDAEMDRQRAIDGLRDDALENQRDRADALVDLEQDTQDRIADIQRNANRSREDIEREFQDAYQDIQRQRVFENLSDDEATSQLLELGRERNRDLRDLGTRSGRRREDVGIRQGRGERDINTEAQEQLTAIQMQTAELQSLTAITEGETAMMNVGLLETQSQTAITASVTAMTDSETAGINAETAIVSTEATQRFGVVAETNEMAATSLLAAGATLQDAANLVGFTEATANLNLAAMALSGIRTDFQSTFGAFGSVLTQAISLITSPQGNLQPIAIAGQTTPAGTPNTATPPTMVAVFNIDGKEVADAIAVPMGDNLAKRQGTRRTVVSGGRP